MISSPMPSECLTLVSAATGNLLLILFTMRMLATFLCTFLLLLFLGTLSYVYLLWNHYWQRVQKLSRDQQHQMRLHHGGKMARMRFDEDIGQFVTTGSVADFSDPPSAVMVKEKDSSNHHHNNNNKNDAGGLLPIPEDKLLAHINHYEKQIVSQLRNAVVETGKSFKIGEIKNSYHVNYNGSLSLVLQSRQRPEELVCGLEDLVHVKTFVKGNGFFKEQQLDQYFLAKQLLEGRTFNTCGVVSSSGSLVNSGLGAHIDSNDLVIRFNNAPTLGHEKDVGTKTGLRIVNSQVVGKPEFKFLESKTRMFSRVPVVVWDPSGYNATLKDWYSNPDYPFFETFFSKRLMRPKEELHLLHPSSLWSIWNWLQSHNKYPLLPNPPSSGFLGLVLALKHCRKVHVYEYVPSMRLTKRCHYYDEEENLGCTIGDWHPLAAEKLMALALNSANKTVVYSSGYLEIDGAPTWKCQERRDESKKDSKTMSQHRPVERRG